MMTHTEFDMTHALSSSVDRFHILRSVDKVREEVHFIIRLGTVEGSLVMPLSKYLRMRDWNPHALRDMLATEMHHVATDWLLLNKEAYISSISETDDFIPLH